MYIVRAAAIAIIMAAKQQHLCGTYIAIHYGEQRLSGA